MDRSILTKAGFPTVDRRQWLELVARSLGKDTDYESLVRHTAGGRCLAVVPPRPCLALEDRPAHG